MHPHAEWRVLLKPWLNALRRAELRQPDLPALPTVSDMRDVWLHVSAPYGDRNNSRVWRLLREAIELVDLLARVDNAAAWYLLLDLLGRSAMAEQYAGLLFSSNDAPILPKFVVEIVEIVLADEDEGHNISQGLMRMLVKNEMPSSVGFEETRQLLLAKWADKHRGEAFDRANHRRVRVSLHVQVDMGLEDDDEARKLFRQLHTLAVAQADLSRIALDADGNDVAADDDGETDEGVEDDENNGEDDEEDAHEEEEEEDEAGDQEEEQAEEEDEDDEETQENGEDDEEDEDDDDMNSEAANDRESDGSAEGISDKEETSGIVRTDRDCGPVEFDSFRILILSNTPVTNLVLRYINKIAATGMRISHFTFATMETAKLHPRTIDEFMRNQILLNGDHRDDRGIHELSIESFEFAVDGIRALSTAIAHSRSLRSLSFVGSLSETGNSTERDLWWPWLAYALFSKDADHSILSVSLGMEALLPSCVERMRAVLNHDDPLAFLYEVTGNDSIDTSSPMTVTLQSSAVVRIGHHSAAETTKTFVAKARAPYWVVRDRQDEDFVEFVVPGTGVCWTESSSMAERKPALRRAMHSIRCLTLMTLEVESLPSVIDFLQLVGDPIEQLKIDSTNDTVNNADLADLVACCPNLKRIDLNYLTTEGFDWLETWCNAHPGKLETLSLEGITAKGILQWCSLFEGLTEPTRALTKSLRRLRISSFGSNHHAAPEDEAEALAETLEACLRMLEANMLIDQFEFPQLEEPLRIKYQARILSHNGDFLAVEEAPLSSSEKFAFLSALGSKVPTEPPQKQAKRTESSSPTPIAQRSLDLDALRSIVAFAAAL